ncbi:MAG: hypothetical protein C4325_08665 [Blastocatellia bacterium]
MLSSTVYGIISLFLWTLFTVFAVLLIARLVISYADPNPFGFVGRLGFRIRRLTEKWVYPAARFLATYRADTRLAPLISLFIGFVIAYFSIRIIGNTLFIIDGLAAAVIAGSPAVFIGFVLYGLISVLVLFIFIRFLAQWFVFTRNTFLGFVIRVTDPIMLPFRRLIPPIGMFDISPMIVLILLGLLQALILNLFVR